MSRRARLFLALAALWMVALTWRLYPHFKDAVRVDGRISTVEAHLADACGERIGPDVETCIAKTGEAAQLMLRQEQAKSVLLILAPLLVYVGFWRPVQYLRARLAARFRRVANG